MKTLLRILRQLFCSHRWESRGPMLLVDHHLYVCRRCGARMVEVD